MSILKVEKRSNTCVDLHVWSRNSNNKAFFVCFYLETWLKIQLTADAQSDSKKKKIEICDSLREQNK